MDDWYVQESDTEDDNFVENKRERPYSIDNKKLLEMLLVLKSGNILELSCDGILNQKYIERQKRKRRKSDNSCEEGMSETTSEIKSTHTASTSECRDSRRPNLTAFDYKDEDFSVGSTTTVKTKKCLPGLKKKMIALDEIEASLRKEDDVRWKSHQVEDNIQTKLITKSLDNHLEDSDASSIIDADMSFQSQDITSQINQIELLLQEEC